jgi:hypothetical protein
MNKKPILDLIETSRSFYLWETNVIGRFAETSDDQVKMEKTGRRRQCWDWGLAETHGILKINFFWDNITDPHKPDLSWLRDNFGYPRPVSHP